MFGIEFVVLCILAIVVFNQSSRITRLEKRITQNNSVPLEQATSPVQAQVQTSPVTASVAEPALIPVAPVSVTPRAESAESHTSEAVSSGRILAVLGIITVFIGMAFFLKYAFDNNWISPVGRVMLGVTAGIVLLGVGQALRNKYLEYSDFLMGGGLAVLYLSVASAHFFYNLISPFTAWFFMAIITAIGLIISLVNGTRAIAMVSVIGGFFVPFMAYSGENNMLALFGYLSILNIGVLGLSFTKNWKELSFVAFMGTVMNFVVWYASFYDTSLMGEALSFCFMTFVIFLVSTLIRSVHQKVISDESDYALLGGNALFLAVFGYFILDNGASDWLGAASAFVAAIYLLTALWINSVNKEDRVLNLILPGLAVTFFSIAIPLQFDGSWVATGWLVESLALYVIACFIGNRGFQVMGATMYGLGIFSFFVTAHYLRYNEMFTPIFNNDFGILVLAICIAYVIAYLYKRYGTVSDEAQQRGISTFVAVANILTVYAITTQIMFYFKTLGSGVSESYGSTVVSIFWAAYAGFLTAIGFIKKVSGIRRMGLTLFFITAAKVLIDVWSLGEIYRIVSLIMFGVIALTASFAYAKYKDRLKDVI